VGSARAATEVRTTTFTLKGGVREYNAHLRYKMSKKGGHVMVLTRDREHPATEENGSGILEKEQWRRGEKGATIGHCTELNLMRGRVSRGDQKGRGKKGRADV